jgi:predicted neuraminidase
MHHAASVLGLEDGRLIAVWYAASYETAPDAVLLRAFWDDGEWDEPEVVVSVPGFSLGNPVLRRSRPDELWLFFALLPEPAWTSARVACMVSRDAGANWESLRFLHAFAGLMTKGRPLEYGGNWLLPVYDEKSWAPMVLISKDEGRSWELVGETTARGKAIQPVIAPVPGGLLMLERSPLGRIHQSRSFDGGRSWTASVPTELPNPNSGIELLTLADGRLCLIYNPLERARTCLGAAFSNDCGESWSPLVKLVEGLGEYSYPSASQVGDLVHILFTANRATIMHAKLDVSRELLRGT